MSQRANYLNEVGMLNRTPRSGFQFLGNGSQSVSQHMYRMLQVAFLLARMSDTPVDELHLLHLVMFHDLPEARTGDHNYVNKKYVSENLDKLLADGERDWPLGTEIAGYVREFEARETVAAQLASDADQLELLVMLKEQKDLGNPHADDWVTSLLARLRTVPGKQLAEEILSTRWDEWWFANKQDPHWVNGKPIVGESSVE